MSNHEIALNGRSSLMHRFLLPSAAGILAYLLLWMAYNSSWHVENRFMHFILADGVGFFYGALIMAGSFVLYPVMYFRGAGPIERFSGSMLILCAWFVKEVIRMTDVFSIGESIYYLLMPMQAGVFLVVIISISLSEMGCRFLALRSGMLKGRVCTWPPLTALSLSALLLVPILYRGGESYFFWFYDMYRLLFMS